MLCEAALQFTPRIESLAAFVEAFQAKEIPIVSIPQSVQHFFGVQSLSFGSSRESRRHHFHGVYDHLKQQRFSDGLWEEFCRISYMLWPTSSVRPGDGKPSSSDLRSASSSTGHRFLSHTNLSPIWTTENEKAILKNTTVAQRRDYRDSTDKLRFHLVGRVSTIGGKGQWYNQFVQLSFYNKHRRRSLWILPCKNEPSTPFSYLHLYMSQFSLTRLSIHVFEL